MPIHDWTRVDGGTFHAFHAFHTAWITHLSEALNNGILPAGFFALPEQHAGAFIADVLTLHVPYATAAPRPSGEGGVAVADAPPRVGRKLTPASAPRWLRRTLAIRHVSTHLVVALMEIVSPANKDRLAHVAEFADKVETALCHGIHVVIADILPPGASDPQGMHGAIWERFDDESCPVPANEPLALASYVADRMPIAYLERLAVGATLIEMPLFLSPDRYINLPLESTYEAAYRGMPAFCRDLLEGRSSGLS